MSHLRPPWPNKGKEGHVTLLVVIACASTPFLGVPGVVVGVSGGNKGSHTVSLKESRGWDLPAGEANVQTWPSWLRSIRAHGHAHECLAKHRNSPGARSHEPSGRVSASILLLIPHPPPQYRRLKHKHSRVTLRPQHGNNPVRDKRGLDG